MLESDRKVLYALSSGRGQALTSVELAELTGLAPFHVRSVLQALRRSGLARTEVPGGWVLTAKGFTELAKDGQLRLTALAKDGQLRLGR